MTISPVALAAKKVIDAAWLHGDAYDLSSQAAFALESAQLLQTSETATELDRLRERATAAPVELSSVERATLAEHLGDAKPATTGLVAQLAKAVRDVREHEHPNWEDLYCFNLVSFMGERMGPVLRRLLDAEARVAELEQLLAAKEHPADEDPIAYALTDKAEADCDHPNGYGPYGCAGCGAFRPPADAEDVTPQVRKLRTLLAGQREQAGGAS